jgi:hypothetical protein
LEQVRDTRGLWLRQQLVHCVRIILRLGLLIWLILQFAS